ncbi:MAG: galactose mutarotase [Melioribacteraceae bacterium]|nr:galactose mutarotase [Melioribacteraceae bacterium]
MYKKIYPLSAYLLTALLLSSCSSPDKSDGKKLFGKLSSGEEVYMYTISNNNGLSADIINYGAIVVSLNVPDRSGNADDIIFGFEDLEGYEKDNSFQGSIVGRYGNRIREGKFKIDGTEYQLSLNDGPNHLHGGFKGFNKVLWTVEGHSKNLVKLSYLSADGEEGYPGNVKIEVTYTLTDKNELQIDYKGTTDAVTILNPTSHCYFNLTGNPESSILDHELMINADKFTPVDNTLIPTGEIIPVEGTPMDFREPALIGKRINEDTDQIKYGRGYDHNWVLNDYTGDVRSAATLYDSSSGRFMEVLTDQPGLQFYSGNFLDGSMIGKSGKKYNWRTALCLEAQKYPDSPNKPEFPSAVLKPGEVYKQSTIYKFSTR